MSGIKIQCNNCGAKFFTLNREEINCKCGHHIIVKEHLKNNANCIRKPPRDDSQEVDLDIIDDPDNFIDEEELLS